MRALLIALTFGLAGAALTPALAGPGGAYTTLSVRDAYACERACADDGLCIAWMLRPNGGCELSATVPSAWPDDAADIGLSRRAPAFASLPERPAASLRATFEPAMPSLGADYPLLGGPDEDTLRSRLGSQQ